MCGTLKSVSPRKPPSEEQLREAFSEVHDALARAVVLSSDRVQSVFEDAVVRGRMTRRDAEELAQSLVALGRDQANELVSEVDALARSIPAKVVEAVDPRAGRRRRKAKADADAAQREEAARFVSAEAFQDVKKAQAKAAAKPKAKAAAKPKASASSDPSTLTVRELTALVPSLTAAQLKTLRTKEAAGKNRAGVLQAIDRKLTA